MLILQHQKSDEFLGNTFLIVLISLFLLWILKKCVHNNPCNNKKLPPSPLGLPILGNLHQLSTLPHRSLQALGAKYGPFMLLHFGSKPVIIVQSANAAIEIIRTHDLIFADKPNTRTTRRLFYDLKDISIAPYGEYWRKLKSLCILKLLNVRRVKSFDFIRKEETAHLMKKIQSCCSSCLPVNLSEMFDSLTNDIICRAAFGRKYSEGIAGKKFLMLLREVLLLLGSSLSIGEFIPYLAWINRVNGYDRRVDRVANEVDDFLELVIQEHLNADSVVDESSESFINILLNVYKDNNSDVSIDRDSLKAIILDVLAGGTDTTSAALEWAMTEILRNPIVLKSLQAEVREIMKNRQDVTNEDLEKMQYLKAVVKETLRLHPPIPFLSREAREDVRVLGYDIPAGMLIITNTWAIGRDPATWDEPQKFDPQRFLKSSIDYKGLDFELIPFGSGRRGCPGIAFAMASVELVLANLVHKFEWELAEDLDMEELPGVTTHRKHPLFAVANHCYF